MPITTKSSDSVNQPESLSNKTISESKYPLPGSFQFRKLIENSHEGISLFDKELNLIYRSLSAVRITGWETSDRIDRDFEGLVHPEDEQEVNALLRDLAKKPGSSRNCTFRSRHFAGHYIWLECSFTNMLDEAEVQSIVCNFRDITDRKRSEELLDQTVQELYAYKYALDESSIVAITDQKGIILYVNDNFCRISKYSAAELIGQDHSIINSSFHDKDYIRDLWVTIANGKTWKGEFKNKAKDGSYYWVDTTIVPFLNDAGKPYKYISVRSDITERKLAELEIKKQKEQLDELLESITDGFIALDEHMNYTYANKKIGEILSLNPEELIGKNIWELFPDAVGSTTFQAMQTALSENRYVCNEDYYAPLKLWQENRVYPSGKGLSVFIRDITQEKQEEHHLKLLESVIINTTDAVLITDAGQENESGPLIVYINEAFTKMTGYLPAEVIGNSPSILQGPKTDKNELKRLSEAMRKWEPCEVTVVNYKKNGDEFWINFSISPVANETGWFTHWISIERDVTHQKNEELQKMLLADASLIFNKLGSLNANLNEVLKSLIDFSDFNMAEAWLIGPGKRKITLAAKYSPLEDISFFFENTGEIKSFDKGKGMPGIAWKEQTIQHWRYEDDKQTLSHRASAKDAGLVSAFSLPLIYNSEIIGVLLLGSLMDIQPEDPIINLLNNFNAHLSAEIKRKQMEVELNQLFNFAPDIICIVGTDAFFKKVNPAMCTILEYTEEELLARPITTFLHPDELEASKRRMQMFIEHDISLYFENRYVTKSGKVKWLSWAASNSNEAGLLYCVAKDITDRKELEKLLDKAHKLARIGVWELDLIKNTVYWSDITREIHETPAAFVPDFEKALTFYKEGSNRDCITEQIAKTIEIGTPCDLELEILTVKGNSRWIRVIAEAEMVDGKCVRVYGSVQDITHGKLSEIKLKELNEYLKIQTKELAISNAELEQFAYVASHDLQEPLRMVTSFLTQIEKKYDHILDDKGRQYIHFAVDGAKRMRQIILDLLDFSKIGRTTDSLEPVDLNTLVDDINNLFHKQIEELHAEVQHDHLPSLKTFRAPIRQVFQNLIGNSLKYHQQDKKPIIKIYCRDVGAHWEFCVNDNGIGIEAEYFDKIFIIFQRLHNKTEYSGTGMGLAITKKIVENMGGEIWLNSVEGEGSSFYFTILKT